MEYDTSSDTETDLTSSIRNDDTDSSSDSDSGTGTYLESGGDKAVQVVKFNRNTDDDDTLKITVLTDPLNKVLSTCGDRRIAIISVVGGISTGKSLLLNGFKEKLKELENGSRGFSPKALKGFHFKSGYKPVTKGLWLWSRAFIVDDDDGEVAVLLMDTEGINDELSKPDEIAAILGISLLSSSLLVINTSGDLSLQEFDWLSRFFGKGGPHFQKMSFLVRDWTRVSAHRHGQKSGNKYLQKFMNKNDTLCGIFNTYCPEMECFLLPHIGEKPLLSKFSGQVSDMEKDFQKSLKTYLGNLLEKSSVPTKKVFENEITAQEFKTFFLQYVKYFNDAQEMELGPRPEKLLSVTRELTGQIKISRGLDEYMKLFNMKRKSGGVLSNSTLDGMHVPARKKALAAFKHFALSSDDEKYFSLRLDEELKKTIVKLKSENQAKKDNKLDTNLEKACNRMTNELDRHFPFTPAAGLDLSAELVFYDDQNLQHRQRAAANTAEEEFLEEFAGEHDDEREELQRTVKNRLEQIEEEFTRKNNENRERAEGKANALIEKLCKEYLAGMQKKLKKLPEADAKVFGVFHDGEMEKVEHKFESVTLGDEEFQAKWLAKLKEKVTREYESMQGNLESTLAKAEELVRNEESNYTATLNGMTTQLKEDELQAFHLNSVDTVLASFANPFPKDNPKHKEIHKKLKKKLDGVYKSIVEGGVLQRIKQGEQTETAVQTALINFQEDLESFLEDKEFLYPKECRDWFKTNQDRSIQWFMNEVKSLGVEKQIAAQGMEQLQSKINILISRFQKKNDVNRDSIEAEGEKRLTYFETDYEKKMKRIQKSVDTIEDLAREHENIQKLLLNKFLERFPTKRESTRREYSEKLKIKLQDIYSEMENLFSLKKKVDDAAFTSAVHQAETYYQENMDKKFNNNKTGYFKEGELEKMHLPLHAAAIANVKVDQPLSDYQKKKLKEQIDKLYQKYANKNELVKHSYCEKEPAIGIDLGTTYCCVAVYHMGTVKILRNSLGTNTTPSYVTINPNGTTLVGQPAKDGAFLNPSATIFDVKRILGRRFNDDKLQSDMKFWPFTVEEKDGAPKIKVHDKYYFPQEISSMVLKHLKKEAEDVLGLKIEKAVITVPAYFTDGQRQATIDAGEMAGFKVLGILNEPTAAAVAYRLEWHNTTGKPRKILVYDLGGGTFDVAVLEISDKNLNVLSISGDSHLGGEDFDKSMMEHCAEEFFKSSNVDLFEGKDSMNKTTKDDCRRRLKRLQINCENSKKALTNARTLETPISISIDEIVRGKDLNVNITRKIFDERNMPNFKRTLKIVDDALESAGVMKNEIDDVVMVGGSTKITMLQEMLEEHFKGKTLNKSLNPDEAVAYGAAVQAAILNSKLDDQMFDFGRIQEVSPMSLGIRVSTGEMDIIIPKNTKIPTSHKRDYRTSKDGQVQVSISVYQGEDTMCAKNNKLLGNFVLSGIPPGPAGKEVIDVTMKINQNGILTVEAVCKGNKNKNSITISDDRGRISNKEKMRLLA